MSFYEQYSDIPRGQVIGSYDTYLEAQRAVDFLSDEQFAVVARVDRRLLNSTPLRTCSAGSPVAVLPRPAPRVVPRSASSARHPALALRERGHQRLRARASAASLRRAVRCDLCCRRARPQPAASATSPRAARSWRAPYEVRCTWAEADKAREILALITPAGG